MTTGTQIANEILDLYRQFSEVTYLCKFKQKVDFKNVQRRVYDALNVLSALDIIRKDKSHIIYNNNNNHIVQQPSSVNKRDQSHLNKDLIVRIKFNNVNRRNREKK